MAFLRFEDIDGGQKGRELTRLVYGLTKKQECVHDFG
jgi:hypothetical protein